MDLNTEYDIDHLHQTNIYIYIYMYMYIYIYIHHIDIHPPWQSLDHLDRGAGATRGIERLAIRRGRNLPEMRALYAI